MIRRTAIGSTRQFINQPILSEYLVLTIETEKEKAERAEKRGIVIFHLDKTGRDGPR